MKSDIIEIKCLIYQKINDCNIDNNDDENNDDKLRGRRRPTENNLLFDQI
jgi:hypothetical protein